MKQLNVGTKEKQIILFGFCCLLILRPWCSAICGLFWFSFPTIFPVLFLPCSLILVLVLATFPPLFVSVFLVPTSSWFALLYPCLDLDVFCVLAYVGSTIITDNNYQIMCKVRLLKWWYNTQDTSPDEKLQGVGHNKHRIKTHHFYDFLSSSLELYLFVCCCCFSFRCQDYQFHGNIMSKCIIKKIRTTLSSC